jgi:hypothetical protein
MKRRADLNPFVGSWHLLSRPERMTGDPEVIVALQSVHDQIVSL